MTDDEKLKASQELDAAYARAEAAARAGEMRKQIGTVGIDAGMLYLGDPCYVIDKPLGASRWDDFLEALYASQPNGGNARWWTVTGTIGRRTFNAGIVTSTGDGDGEYPVFVELSADGAVKSVTVEFIRGRHR